MTMRYTTTYLLAWLIEKTSHSKSGEIGILIHSWGECKMVQPPGKQLGGFLKY